MKLKNKLKSKKGMTLVELLCALIILLLVSSGMVEGIRFAQVQYEQSIEVSESETLYATLQTILSNELQYTTSTTLDSRNNVRSFFSKTYAIQSHETNLVCLDSNGVEVRYGQLALGSNGEYNRLLSKSAYSKLEVSIDSFTYDESTNYFTVELSIRSHTKSIIEHREFQVNALGLTNIKRS